MHTLAKWLAAAVIVGAPLAALPAATAAGPVTTARAASTAVSAGDRVVVARFYEDADYRGAVLTMWGTLKTDTRACTATTTDKEYTKGWVGSEWNDRISSVKTYYGCDARLYEDANGGGSYTGWIDRTNYVGDAFNDETSSIRLS